MRKILIALLILVAGSAVAQPTNYTRVAGRYRWTSGFFDSTLHLPSGTTPKLGGGFNGPGALFYKTTDSAVYKWTGTQWLPLALSDNIYTSNGTLTGNRTLNTGGFDFIFTGTDVASAGTARFLQLTPTIVANANNNTLVGLDVQPTFTNGAFTGVTNLAARFNGRVSVIVDNVNPFTISRSPNASLAANYMSITNLGVNLRIGLEGDAGGSISSGTLPYASVFATPDNRPIHFGTNGSQRLTIFAGNGNVAINGTSDGGQRLQVNGDAYIKGSGNTSATSALLVQDGTGAERFKVLNDGVVELSNRLKLNTIAGLSTGTVNIDASFSLLNSSSGSYTRIALGSQSVSSSGNFISSGFRDNVVANITSTSTLDYTSFLASPTLTALTAGSIYKAFGWTNNTGWGLYGGGTAPNYLGGSLGIGQTSPSRLLEISTPAGGEQILARFRGGNAASNAGIEFVNSTNINSQIVGLASTNGLSFRYGTTEGMRLTGAGRLLLGTTSEGTQLLQVNGNANISTDLTIGTSFTGGSNTGTINNFTYNAGLGGVTFNRFDSYSTSNFFVINQANYGTAANGSNLYVSVNAFKASGFALIKAYAPATSGSGSTYIWAGNAQTVTPNLQSINKLEFDLTTYLGPTFALQRYAALDIKIAGRTADYAAPTTTNVVGIYFQNSLQNNFGSTILPAQSWKTIDDATTFISSATPYTAFDIRPVFTSPNNTANHYGINVNPTLNGMTSFYSLSWSNNTGWGLYGAGTANNYLAGKLIIGTTSVGTQIFQVNGDAFIKGTGTNNLTSGLLMQNSAGTKTFEVTNSGSLIVNDALGTQNLSINRIGSIPSSSIAIGTPNGTTASGNTSISIGQQSNATAESAIAIGSVNNVTGAYGIGIGFNTAVGASAIAIGQGARATQSGSIALGPGNAGVGTLAPNQFVAATITEVYFGDGVRPYSGNGTSYLISGSGSAGTDANGGNITIGGGRGTGAGIAGDVIFSTSTAIGSGATEQTRANRWWIKGTTGTLTNTATPDASAIFSVVSTTQGVLLPRMTTTQINAIASPAAGLIVYNTTLQELCFYDGTNWKKFSHSNM